MLDKLRDICVGFRSLIVGLGVSGKTCFEPPVTEQYPDEVFNRPFKRHGVAPRRVSERYRGTLALAWDWEHEITACIACRACERACPSKCIGGIETIGRGRERRAASFSIELSWCCHCGLCVEACPVKGNAIRSTPDFETVATDRQELAVDFDWLHDRGKEYWPRPADVVVEPWPPPKPDAPEKKQDSSEQDA